MATPERPRYHDAPGLYECPRCGAYVAPMQGHSCPEVLRMIAEEAAMRQHDELDRAYAEADRTACVIGTSLSGPTCINNHTDCRFYRPGKLWAMCAAQETDLEDDELGHLHNAGLDHRGRA